MKELQQTAEGYLSFHVHSSPWLIQKLSAVAAWIESTAMFKAAIIAEYASQDKYRRRRVAGMPSISEHI